jgi:uncharacterized protein
MQTLFSQLVHACRQGFLLVLGLMLTVQLAIAPAALATGVYELPKTAPSSHILDLAEVLSVITENQVNTQLDTLKDQNVAIVTVRRLDYEETIDTFAQALFQRWYPDAATQANQTLLVIDTLTNNTGIIQGEQAKTVMSEAIAKSVAQETIGVPLKFGSRYNQAFMDASDRMTKVMSGEEDPGAPEVKIEVQTERNFATKEETKESNATVWVIVLLVLSTAIPMATYYYYQWAGNRPMD